MARVTYRYSLTEEGVRRTVNNEFYLQKTPRYKGYTEKIFRLLHKVGRPLTLAEISDLTKIKSRSVNGVITFNVIAGYIKRETF
jgi:hypothetical protein